MESSAALSIPDSSVAAPAETAQGDSAPADFSTGARSNPEEFQASLEAVRVAQETAHARARRETRRARMILLGVMAALGIVAWNISARRSHKTQAAMAAPAVAAAAPIAPSSPTPPALPSLPVVSAPAAEPAPVIATADVPAAADYVPACDGAFAAHQWPSVVTACAAAFKTRPHESALAMRVAQAQHRRGDYEAAGEWARKAIALDANLAEAFVIIAHAEGRAGHPRAAATAYRRYLSLAPRGWHAAEARSALGRSDQR